MYYLINIVDDDPDYEIFSTLEFPEGALSRKDDELQLDLYNKDLKIENYKDDFEDFIDLYETWIIDDEENITDELTKFRRFVIENNFE